MSAAQNQYSIGLDKTPANYVPLTPLSFLARSAAVYPDLLAALEFAAEEAGRDPGCLNQGLKLAAALYGLWVRRGPVAEGALHLGRLLDLDDALQASSTPDRVAAVLAAGWLFCHKGDFPRAAELARHTIELCAPVADHRSLSWAYLLLGEAAIDTGDDTTAEGHYQCALSEAAQAGHQRNQAEAWNLLGQIARHRGDYDRAARLLGHALGMCRAAGLHGHAGSVLGSLGEVARDTGQPARRRSTKSCCEKVALLRPTRAGVLLPPKVAAARS